MDKEKCSLYAGWAAKRAVLIIHDIFAVTFSYWFALIIRFYVNFQILPTASAYIPAFGRFAPWYAAICIIIFACFKLYNSMWKYAGLNDLNRIFGACAVTTVVHVAGTMLFVQRMPITYYVFGAVIQFLLLTASRFSYRVFIAERSKLLKVRNKATINVMIVGIGETARIVRKQIENDHANIAHPVCIFAYRKTNGIEMQDGVPVVSGMEKLKDHILKYKVKCVILADSLMLPENRKQIKEICQEMDIEVQDFSWYFSNTNSGVSFGNLMEHTSGAIDIVIDGKVHSFSNGEAAMMSLNGNYGVKDISAKGSRLVVELVESRSIINDTSTNWGREYEEQTGQELSFF